MTATAFLFALLAVGPVAPAPAQTGPPVNAAVLSPCGPGQLSITGIVKDQAGTPIPGAVVSILNLDTKARAVVGTGDKRDPSTGADIGKYCSGTIAPGRYTVSVEKSAFIRQFEGEVDLRAAATGPRTLDFVIYRDAAPLRGSGLFALAGVVLLYLASIWLVRWYNVAWPARGPLQARLTTLRERLGQEPDVSARNEANALIAIVDREIEQTKRGTFIDFLFWSLGHEQHAWMQIHDIEQRLVELLPDQPLERLVARLRSVEEELRAIGTKEAITLADTARTTLAATPRAADLRAQISEGLQLVYDTRDDKYWNLAVWQNKSTWLLLAAAGMVVAVASVGGRVPLLVAGASGGLLSRLLRAQRAQEVPSDYGASWPTLFFSPLLGALTGWFGVLLLVGLNSLNLLGTVFKDISWDNPMAPLSLAAALLMGISERLFDGLVNAAEQKAGATKPDQGAERTPADTTTQKAATQATAAPQSAPIHIEKVEPPAANPGQKVTLTGWVLTPDNVKPLETTDVKQLFLVGKRTRGLEVSPLSAGAAGGITFTIPDAAAAGEYQLKLIDPRGGEREESKARLTVTVPAPAPTKP